MANDANKVFVGKPRVTGGIYAAPVGTALPTDDSAALDAAFKPVGYITDDGLTRTENRDSDKVIAWGGDTIALIQKSFGVDFKFKMAELLNPTAQSVLYGTPSVSATEPAGQTPGTLKVAVSGAEPPHNSWVFEMKNGTRQVRIVVPDGQIGDTGDVDFKDDDVASLDVTVSAFADGSGNLYYMYASGIAAPSAPTVNKGAAAPGTTFPAEATVTASDASNAAKLSGLGYVAAPTTAWTSGQKITVGTYDFNWSGSAWAAGAHA